MRKIFSSISYKLTIPTVFLVAIIIVINIYSKKVELYDRHETTAIAKADEITRLMHSKMDASTHKALLAASICSELPFAKWAYTVYNTTNNLDSASAIIERNIEHINKKIEKTTKSKPKIHFMLPPARSFIRCWTDKRGDDISSFRKTVLSVNTNHKAIKGLEVGREGFANRGIAPVFNNKQEFLGSVEVIFPFTNILKRIIKDEKESYAIYISKDKLKIAQKLSKEISDNGNINNYVLVKKSDKLVDEYFTDEDFKTNTKEAYYKIAGNYVYSYVPILDYYNEIVGLTIIQIDISEQIAGTQAKITSYIVFGIIILLIVTILLIIFINIIVSKPIKRLTKNIIEIAKGKLISNIKIKNKDEIGIIYGAFNQLLDRLRASSNFATEIGKGNLNVNIDNINDDDVLSHSLIAMRNNLTESKELEKTRQEEDEKRNWATQGYAEFGEILRQNNDNIEELSTNIVKNLVNYTGSNQGGLFLINDNDENNITLDLAAAYAFDRKKFVDKSIKLGEGLIGTCAIEKDTIYITEIPENYIKITSGLGESNPRNILIVPLKIEEKIFGVLELASFTLFDKHKIEFIEKLGESIASTLSSTKTNTITVQLLEQSQQQQEEMSAQEEEMRQNMEEMQATQEEAERQQQELRSQEEELKQNMEEMQATQEENEKQRKNMEEMQLKMGKISSKAAKASFNIENITSPVLNIDFDYNIIYMNEAAVKIAGKSREDAIGEKCYDLFNNPHCKTKECRIAQAMETGETKTGKTVVKGTNVLYTGIPLFDDDGDIMGAIEEITDISDIDNV